MLIYNMPLCAMMYTEALHTSVFDSVCCGSITDVGTWCLSRQHRRKRHLAPQHTILHAEACDDHDIACGASYMHVCAYVIHVCMTQRTASSASAYLSGTSLIAPIRWVFGVGAIVA